eukprot:CAMPEP_0196661180 /NCGR_PEP_ID=MMETSP1086-20130531/43088_1 /TAXON_ID=77921 /ORGANISM="Cyanoptyche  gloeocystis , Strain SAG4.97" /LENGTH=173 /DNA_ID=CAMNT_0041995961 /DNA_START=260 /DNA_END=781 /DNA_ORIENTATION=+
MIAVGGLGFLMGCTENKCVIWIYCLICNIVMIPLIVVGVILVYASSQISTFANTSSIPNSYVYNKIRDAWINAVNGNTAQVCSYMQNHRCSGFNDSCSDGLNNQCPSSCDANTFSDTCSNYLIDDLESIAKALGGIAIAFAALMILGSIISWVFCCCPTSLSVSTKKKHNSRV